MVRATQSEIQAAVEALRAGDLVAFPTETVYGLGANASNPAAVRKIFAAKGRPADHPLIVHLDSIRYLHRWVRDVPPLAEKLASRFWPGPMTLVLPKAANVLNVVTGGQETIAIRVPGHPMAQQLLTAFGGGIAAPSANRYGHVSPTRAEHVREDLGDTVRIVLDGGECAIGVESTILSCIDDHVRLLRPGSITLSQIRSVVGDVLIGADEHAPRVPGSTATHYATATPLEIVPGETLESLAGGFNDRGERVAVLALRLPLKTLKLATWINAGRRPQQYAHDLYAHLRTLDKAGCVKILVQELPADERWDAVRDRLEKASAKVTPASSSEVLSGSDVLP
ncbi:MAG TPA: L-threonylcarbamoyladenylate synthase [Steroidobacteraceae bacterium]|nr:L-threonylcarbamoyladenylate synthase [Steroidobacteraceae bacterium]